MQLPCFSVPFSLILVGFILEGERFIRRKSRVTGEEETGRKTKEEDRELHSSRGQEISNTGNICNSSGGEGETTRMTFQVQGCFCHYHLPSVTR